MARRPNLLLLVPPKWASDAWSGEPDSVRLIQEGRDSYAPDEIDYVLSFRPEPGRLAGFPHLKAIFSLGAGVDGFFADGRYPKHVPLVRFVDDTLSREMAQYVLMHVLIHHRGQRGFDAAQREGAWRQSMLPRRTEDTRIGMLGLGEIGRFAARELVTLGFPVAGWSRTRKDMPGVKSFAGDGELPVFLAQSDILVCLLSLTRKTHHILNARTFAQLPRGAFVINVARGGHLNEPDLIAALDSGHLSGAVLDVFEEEPLPAASPLWTHPKVTVTPHIAAISQPAIAMQSVLHDIAILEAGGRPAHVVDVDAAY